MTEPSTSAVELAVTARIAAAKRRTEDMRRQRAELAEARKAGLARRHAAKLAYLDDAEQCQAGEQDDQDEPSVSSETDDEQHGRDADHRASVRRTDGSASVTPTETNTTEGAAP